MHSPHPILERQDLPLERRVQLLEMYLAQLWDQVWWMNLQEIDPARRAQYEREGFSAPIQKFYDD